jgi:precorrin-6Y C5,15-methyltransferase (decarboxylating)
VSDVSRETSAPWLTVLGVGDNGAAGLSAAALAVVQSAQRIIGSQRLLDRLRPIFSDAPAPQVTAWSSREQTLAAILACRGQPTVVLATGDPMFFGLGSTLAPVLAEAGIATAEWSVIPTPGAFSLAAARMGWPLQNCRCLTVHGRPLESVRLHLAPQQKLLLLSATGETPAQVARLLAADGYGPSQITVLSHMGGADEQRLTGRADAFPEHDFAALNTLAIECHLAPGARPRPHSSGLPDACFDHDGQITKQEIRAVTLAALAPWPGAHLWDVGSGSGSIAIEWMRAAPGATALAIDHNADRVGRIGRNALALGVPDLRVVLGKVPGVLPILDEDFPQPPDVIFVGGGVSAPGVLDKLWNRLPPGGRLVANAVTLQAETALAAFYAAHGGQMRRLAVSRLVPVGAQFERWDSLAPVTQLCAEKP